MMKGKARGIAEKSIVRLVDQMIGTGTLIATLPGGKTLRLGPGGEPTIALTIHDRRTMMAIILNPDPAFPEAYMDGRVTIEQGDLLDFFHLIAPIERASSYPVSARMNRRLRFAARRLSQWNGLTASLRNVKRHYDLSPAMYRRFLDADMQYSCAYFSRPGMSLEDAQAAKKRHIAAKLMIEPSMSVLDIGCGWGGMALTLANECDACVTGITLSEEQLAVARERGAGRDDVRFELRDYRTLEQTYDRIVSVGMFEHVGIRNYKTFFQKSHDLLARDGVMLLHTIGRSEPPNVTSGFIHKYIFPGGYIPALSEVSAAIERAGLTVTDVEVLTTHYADTLAEWRNRFHATRDEVLEEYDERFFRMWDLYLAASEAAFRYYNMVVFQIQIVHDKTVVPMSRDYIEKRERELAKADSEKSRSDVTSAAE
ncbi:cyclopropane-fatty-acyl-phospholipid synthase family protein [Notoacmeibacter sp. MSK16QG-6]|uniref:SAM-dependent methyltransferase n=1 Tax=Notoacmeibacter sp. MSK16QG-6 TaxID=2957982 RepID=UPI00209FDE18|nr:cyclopropane-fatty-acyl-phospholipid synthase family protein [Notoacmeibacter sp. MSK16QG-6]MCP1197994.1 cyclopropane-fatty-acyl-phospholipid synthase family protein [Notoacmeibacter sp. MSK16QG-6]